MDTLLESNRELIFLNFSKIYLFGNSMRPWLFVLICASRASGFSCALQPTYFLCRSSIFVCPPIFQHLRRKTRRFRVSDYQLAKWYRYVDCCFDFTVTFSTASICPLGVGRLYPRSIGGNASDPIFDREKLLTIVQNNDNCRLTNLKVVTSHR